VVTGPPRSPLVPQQPVSRPPVRLPGPAAVPPEPAGSPATPAAVPPVAAAVRSRMPELIERTTAEIVRQMAVYADEVHVSRADLRASVVANLDAAVGALEGTAEPDLSRVAATGRTRAQQGHPLPELVRAFRIGLREVWLCVVDQLAEGRPGDLAVLTAATSVIWQLADEYAEVLTAAYRSANQEIVLAHQAQRSALLEALFAGGAATEGALWHIARVLDLSLEGEFVAVAAETAVLGQEPLAGIEARLRAAGHASAWRLAPELQAGVVSLRNPGASAAVLEILGDAATARIGLSPVYAGLDGTARALHFARVALSTLPAGRPGTAEFTASPLAGLIATSPEASVELARQVLGPLLALPGEEGDTLLLTLREWFAARGSTNVTAERMYCHPNTIRLRLRRITEELGRPLGDPEHVAELGAALRAMQLFPAAPRIPDARRSGM
jgi:PucR C-terminal helix-turn-helix domain/GGDEF-like domain